MFSLYDDLIVAFEDNKRSKSSRKDSCDVDVDPIRIDSEEGRQDSHHLTWDLRQLDLLRELYTVKEGFKRMQKDVSSAKQKEVLDSVNKNVREIEKERDRLFEMIRKNSEMLINKVKDVGNRRVAKMKHLYKSLGGDVFELDNYEEDMKSVKRGEMENYIKSPRSHKLEGILRKHKSATLVQYKSELGQFENIENTLRSYKSLAEDLNVPSSTFLQSVEVTKSTQRSHQRYRIQANSQGSLLPFYDPFLNCLYIYSLTTNRWKQLEFDTQIVLNTASKTLFVPPSTLWITGAEDSSERSIAYKIEVSLEGIKKTRQYTMRKPHNYHALVWARNELVVLGACIFSKATTTTACESISEFEGTFRDFPSYNTPRYNHAACYFKDSIYIFGGEIKNLTLQDTNTIIERFDYGSQKWVHIPITDTVWKGGQSMLALPYKDHQILLLGGEHVKGSNKDLYIFDAEDNAFDRLDNEKNSLKHSENFRKANIHYFTYNKGHQCVEDITSGKKTIYTIDDKRRIHYFDYSNNLWAMLCVV
eukprot:CAMPEP_0115040602 /NCGR_PEP_ID=MMETSP0216-20121206/44929_1 /TAXON_ID=223996 /ORGANISM="Protocruzia adherens, Strain Boccale" /LENGTH=531 /DNA_ID=CAMNT_0002421879 /DNA_START=491 /DNA_END=2086 /DNA_ORIENTATION=+